MIDAMDNLSENNIFKMNNQSMMILTQTNKENYKLGNTFCSHVNPLFSGQLWKNIWVKILQK